MNYKEIKVKVKHEDAETAGYAFIECGSEGSSIQDFNDALEIINKKDSWDYYDQSLKGDLEYAYVSGGFEESFNEKELIDLISSYLGYIPEYTASIKEKIDYEEQWKENYSITDYGRFYVVPVWLDREMDKPKVITDPGMAFGTGLHETTSMCLENINEYCRKGTGVIDIGCGSGLLGVAALKCGCKSCDFTDIDELAVKATEEMLKMNNEKGRVMQKSFITSDFGCYDLVLANLCGDLLIKYTYNLVKLLRTDSVIILSGILNEQAGDVIEAFESFGLKLLKHKEKGEWSSLVLKRE